MNARRTAEHPVFSQQHSSENLQKYESPNVAVQFLLRRFLNQLIEFAAECNPERILDVGCGEGLAAQTVLGHLSLERQPRYVGVDLSLEALRVAEQSAPRADLGCMSADALALRDSEFDLVLCVEVLEHVPDPRAVLAELQRVSSRYCLISVPFEPFFRLGNLMRGRHIRSWGDHPEHIHHWGPRSLQALVSQFFMVKKLTRPFPWLMVLCERNSSAHVVKV